MVLRALQIKLTQFIPNSMLWCYYNPISQKMGPATDTISPHFWRSPQGAARPPESLGCYMEPEYSFIYSKDVP